MSDSEAMPSGPLQERDPDGTLRFHMTQNGRAMTADDFSAWMSKHGLRVKGPGGPYAGPMPPSPMAASGSGMMRDRSLSGTAQGQGGLRPVAIQPLGSDQSLLLGSGDATFQSAPSRGPAVGRDGVATGYDSGSSQYGVAPSSSSWSQSRAPSATVTAYDSGHDY
jgi:hypothetical protein